MPFIGNNNVNKFCLLKLHDKMVAETIFAINKKKLFLAFFTPKNKENGLVR